METVAAVLFIGTVIAGLTQLFKFIRDKDYTKAIVVVAAALFGALVGVLDVYIGVQNITIAMGTLIGLAAAGVVGTVEKIG